MSISEILEHALRIINESSMKGRCRELCLQAMEDIETSNWTKVRGLTKAVTDLPEANLTIIDAAAAIEALVEKELIKFKGSG